MKCPNHLLISALIALAFSACSTGPRRAAPSPQYSGVVTKAGDAAASLTQAQSDNKEVKKAIQLVREYNLKMSTRASRMNDLLDKADYKTSKLLEK